MSTFSERIGARAPRTALQIESVDGPLRNKLWNAFDVAVLQQRPNWRNVSSNVTAAYERGLNALFSSVWHTLLKLPLDTIPDTSSESETRYALRKMFFDWEWHEVYSFIEFIVQQSDPDWSTTLREISEGALESEHAGYRFVGSVLTPITNKVELAEIDAAANSSFQSVQTHIDAAIAHYSDRVNPDYRNSVKESISAVEAICKVVTGSPSASLGDALKEMKRSKPMHPALEQGLSKLYGYASDDGGIRHALIEGGQTPTAAEAKFMLVVTSAFVNYITELRADAAKGHEGP